MCSAAGAGMEGECPAVSLPCLYLRAVFWRVECTAEMTSIEMLFHFIEIKRWSLQGQSTGTSGALPAVEGKGWSCLACRDVHGKVQLQPWALLSFPAGLRVQLPLRAVAGTQLGLRAFSEAVQEALVALEAPRSADSTRDGQ